MNNQITNQKTEVSKGISLNEKDYLTCLNATLKEMSKNYALVMSEASNEDLYTIYHDLFEKISQLQREVYELMFKKGWYILEKCDISKIQTKYQTLEQEYSDLNG